jgi:hypothetical protein
MSLNPTPGSGQSGTSRIFCERLELAQALLAALGVPRAERGRDDGFEQARLPVGPGAERPEVPRGDPEPREPPARGRDLGVSLGVALLPVLRPRHEQAELLELARELVRDARPVAEVVELEVEVALGERLGALAATLLAGGARELLADHAQREELVALELEDPAQALHVVLAEEPIAAARPPRREQPLVLEEANLRDRDVRELVLQAGAHRADREQRPLPS